MNLSELLVALSVLGVTLGALLGFLQEGHRAHAVGDGRMQAQQNARVALARMTTDIRQAGLGIGRASFPAITVAQPSRIVINHDRHRVMAGGSETISWFVAGGVLRRDAGGGAQPIINGVRDLTMAYFDADGRATTSPADVRLVEITLTVGPDHISAATGTLASMSTQVRLRNR